MHTSVVCILLVVVYGRWEQLHEKHEQIIIVETPEYTPRALLLVPLEY